MSNIEILSYALEYIEENICENITAEDVASACYCSKSGLQKVFRYVHGHSVKEYVIKRRITKAARDLINNTEESILEIALKYCYGSPEAFTRAFLQVWKCTPSTFRKQARFTQLHPRLLIPIENGDEYMKGRKHLDITELYDLFKQRKECFFVGCDICCLVPINNIAYEAGDLAILEVLKRMEKVAGEEDIAFRIGGDEFVLLTNSTDSEYATNLKKRISEMNGETFSYEDKEIPLSVHTVVMKFHGDRLQYDDLFISLHTAIRDGK